MLKFIYIIIIFLFCHVVSMDGQHLKFMGIELGQNSEYFKYKLTQKGFTFGKGRYKDHLIGQYLVRESNIYCHEKNDSVDVVSICYGNRDDFSYSEAVKLKNGVVEILIEELKKTEKFILEKDVPTFSICYGDVFYLKDGYIQVFIDGRNECRVLVRYCDAPDNIIYKYLSQ